MKSLHGDSGFVMMLLRLRVLMCVCLCVRVCVYVCVCACVHVVGSSALGGTGVSRAEEKAQCKSSTSATMFGACL